MLSKIDPKQLSELTIVLVESCNMNCSYCQQQFSNKILKKNDLEVLKKINLDKIEKPILIELFGGEPIQEKTYEIFKDTIEYIFNLIPESKKHLLKFKINTNAKFTSDNFFQVFKFLNINSNFDLIISFDGLWQEKRSNSDPILNAKIIENIKKYFNACFAHNIKISFSYSGSELEYDKYALVKNYLYIRKLFPVSNNSIKYYLIREPWKWDQKLIQNYIENFKNLCNWSLNELKNGSKIEPFYFKKFEVDYSKKLGCGFGYNKFTILPEGKISACSLDNDFSIEEGIELNKIYENCKDCEIFNHCDKTCPKKIFYRNQNNINPLCELKKEEYKVFKKYKEIKEKL